MLKMLTRLIESLLLLILLVVGLTWTYSGWLQQMSLRRTLQDAAVAVQKAPMMPVEKEQLLDRIDTVRDRIKSGSKLGWLDWLEWEERQRNLLVGGIEWDEAPLMDREVEWLDRELSAGSNSFSQ